MTTTLPHDGETEADFHLRLALRLVRAAADWRDSLVPGTTLATVAGAQGLLDALHEDWDPIHE